MGGKCAFEDCSEKLIVYGISGSYAEQYAKENNITFQSITLTDDNSGGETVGTNDSNQNTLVKAQSLKLVSDIKAKKAGKGKTVTITALATDGSNKKAKVRIKIIFIISK